MLSLLGLGVLLILLWLIWTARTKRNDGMPFTVINPIGGRGDLNSGVPAFDPSASLMQSSAQNESMNEAFGSSPPKTTTQVSTAKPTPLNLDSDLHLDPENRLAEADVYLSYGRDAQAEEILQEEKEHNPSDPKVWSLCLKLYAKKHDLVEFHAHAAKLNALVDKEDPLWLEAKRLARDLGSVHPLFRENNNSFAFAASKPYTATDMTFTPSDSLGGMNDLWQDPGRAMVTPENDKSAFPPLSGMVNFDLNSLNLDVGTPPSQATGTMSLNPADTGLIRSNTKLSLAQEFIAIGDNEGARRLIQEVISGTNSSPEDVNQARSMMAELA
jgi:FimV-like protein